MGAKETKQIEVSEPLDRESHQFPRRQKNGLFFGADYNPEQWDRSVWNEDVRLMKEVSSSSAYTPICSPSLRDEAHHQARVNVVSLAIFSWALIETADDVWDFTWLDDIINLLHKNDISVDLATATASPPPWLTTAHPEILPINKEGQTMSPGSRMHWRSTSPVYRRYALRLVQKLAQRYGTHPAVIAWHVNNELGYQDYSDDAAAAFRLWLEKRYRSIAALNTAWGTSFWSQRYNDWSEILPPRLAVTFINPTQQLDWARFSSDALNDYLQAERDILRQYSEGIPVTTNFMLAGQTKGMDVANWDVDFVSNDHYRTQARENDKDELSFSASLTSAVAGGRPWWLMEHSTSAVNWQPVNVAKKRNELLRDSLTHVAHGADAVCFFQWRQSESGAEKYHSAMIPHRGPSSRLFRDVVQLGQHLSALSEVSGSFKVKAPIAIVWDWESWVASEMDGHPTSLLDYFREALEWYVALLDLGFRVDVIPSHAALSDYKMVIGPILYLVDTHLEEKIHDYVHQGGHFITTYFSGIVDRDDRVKLGGYPGAFRDLLGICVEEWAPLHAQETVSLDDGTLGTIWSEQVDLVDDGVKVLRKYTGGELDGLPAVTHAGRGNGSAAYVSTRLGTKGLVKLLPDLLREANLTTDLPSSLRGLVDHVIRSDGEQEWVFLINRTEKELNLGDVEGQLLLATGEFIKDQLASKGVAIFRRRARM